MNNNVIIKTVEEHKEDSEDEQDLNIVNNDLKKFPDVATFTIPAKIKTLLETKVQNIKPEDWTLDTLKNSRYTLYRFLSELMTSSFTEEYLKTHKKSGKGGKTGTVKREPMDPKIIEEIVDYTTQTWKDLKGTTPQLMRQAISKYLGQFLNNMGKKLKK
ncbi:hypothetical protein OUZ56_005906 [Daphnia magna]|uniref:BEN domain-containing protein n=1 Tax=Daphnia magna TaxID=35525 RepID=A0ABQ9YU29_9CRUS|nr:hypothetical protein OUZ56_005906 [Daphnia magna]